MKILEIWEKKMKQNKHVNLQKGVYLGNQKR